MPRMRAIAPLLVSALVVACSSPLPRTADRVPEDGSVRRGHEIEILAGPAVSFREIGGASPDAKRLLVAPGRHEIRYRVRRDLSGIDYMIGNVFHIGECTLELNALAGFDYRVRYASGQESGRITRADGGFQSRGQTFHTQMLLENTVTGDVTPLACELLFDCRRLRPGVRHSRYCASY